MDYIPYDPLSLIPIFFGSQIFSRHRHWLSISRNVRVCICVFSCSLFEILFKCLLAPTSQSWMSKLLRYSESLGKSSGKKWGQIWTFLLKNGRKSPRREKFLLDFFNLFTFEVPFKRLFAPANWSRMPKMFKEKNSTKAKKFYFKQTKKRKVEKFQRKPK